MAFNRCCIDRCCGCSGCDCDCNEGNISTGATDDTGDKNGIPFGLTLTLRPSRSNSFSNIRNVLQIITERCNDISDDC
ncbi:hypothetical protein DERF_014105 [Dermatophagoides farinae]|uniref:Uncharacterized protein n=1 Tax=Dermatophagoides farinae TaxID=6954 RepID=A0A922HGN0_DERFA|nr:hypothetical protein DERF_014105 [Dermatophagoides farinae]